MLEEYKKKLDMPKFGKYISNYYRKDFIEKLLNMYDRQKLKKIYIYDRQRQKLKSPLVKKVEQLDLDTKIKLYKDIKKLEAKAKARSEGKKVNGFELEKSNSKVNALLIVNLLEDVSSQFVSDNISELDTVETNTTNETLNLKSYNKE